MAKLSILIPARNEEFLQKTVDDILEHAEGDTEVLVGEDTEPIGQRAMTNALARRATGEYVMKVDAHCSFSQGFDVKMMEAMEPNMIMAPAMMNLHAYDWNCHEHGRMYQGKACCSKAEKIVVWRPKQKPIMANYVFNRGFVMEYAPVQKTGDIVDTMCLQGSAWMVSRENYWKWNLCDESLGSWGCQAVELGIKAYLNGGRCVTNRQTYYAHLFRGADDFPYERGEDPGKLANIKLQEMYADKIQGLVEKFEYPCDWGKNVL